MCAKACVPCALVPRMQKNEGPIGPSHAPQRESYQTVARIPAGHPNRQCKQRARAAPQPDCSPSRAHRRPVSLLERKRRVVEAATPSTDRTEMSRPPPHAHALAARGCVETAGGDAKSPGAETPGLLVVGPYRLGGQATSRLRSAVQLTPIREPERSSTPVADERPSSGSQAALRMIAVPAASAFLGRPGWPAWRRSRRSGPSGCVHHVCARGWHSFAGRPDPGLPCVVRQPFLWLCVQAPAHVVPSPLRWSSIARKLRRNRIAGGASPGTEGKSTASVINAPGSEAWTR